MPAAASSRQPGAPIRFSGPEAQWLLAEERRWLAAHLAVRPARPWLWLAPAASVTVESPMPPRCGLCLHECAGGYAGTVRCGLPLPLANECLGEVVLQHPSPAQAGALLDECARVLVEGGRLWLFLANPWSPYRLRSVRDLPASASGPWVQRLRALGLRADPPRFLGPRWRMARGGEVRDSAVPLRAGCVVVAEKRGLAPVAPAPLAWRRGTAPAA
ncbi:MAG: hypothetical protein J0L89_12390 [Xanthomonadales bacterium]|nr:hypothetical protein [Xanthomonadaceae bacterium]MBN8225592.1 hypothetical protein [Xanthomonadales bacterium]MCA0199167.1 hypothetical protein [Pseudomonadota bacterium]